MNVERRPGGAYEILPGGARGPLVWRNRGGRRELTAHGRAVLGNFQDMLLWVPVFEQQFDTGLRAYDPAPRRTWYPLSADTFEGLLEELQSSVPLAFANRLQDLPALPPAFKDWVLERLLGEDGLIDESSDRGWTYDDTGTWHLSIQHTEMRAGRLTLVTDLDRPMLQATPVLYDAHVPLCWHLSAAASAGECVPLSLAEALQETPEYCKAGLSVCAARLGQDRSEGFTRAAVLAFLEEHSGRLGKQVGYKALQDGRVVASKKAAPGAPFVAWSQWANHMYLYRKDTPALNARPQRTAKTLRVGVQQYTRALQTIPDELRTRFLRKDGAALCLWELRHTKKLRAPETPEFLPWDGELRAGFFGQIAWSTRKGSCWPLAGRRKSRWQASSRNPACACG